MTKRKDNKVLEVRHKDGETESKVRGTKKTRGGRISRNKPDNANYKSTHTPVQELPISTELSSTPPILLENIVFHATIDGFHKRELNINNIDNLMMEKRDSLFYIFFKDRELIFPSTSVLYYEILKPKAVK